MRPNRIADSKVMAEWIDFASWWSFMHGESLHLPIMPVHHID